MTTVSSDVVNQIIVFHGHFCPGLATGIRVSEIALRILGPRADDEEIIAVVETLNCAVDAIQYLTGCTIGKGNLFHLDYGKNAFTVARRSDGKAVRVANKPRKSQMTDEEQALVGRVRSGEATAEEREAYQVLWRRRGQEVLDAPEDELFVVTEIDNYEFPPKATIVPSVRCDRCGELTMSTRMTKLDGQNLCPSCFGTAPQIALTQVGTVENELIYPRVAPRARSERSVIHLLPQYMPALQGLSVGDSIELYFIFDRAPKEISLLQHPFGRKENPLTGAFGMRTPHRPSPLGMTTVEILELLPEGLAVKGLDAWNGSPIVDIKPKPKHYSPEWLR